jgi:hypothetical protein
MARIERAQHVREALEVAAVRRRDDVDVLRGTRKPVRRDRQPADQRIQRPASASAAINSSGVNIRLAAQVVLDLGGDAAQRNGLLQARGHRPLRVPSAILRTGRLVATNPTLDSLSVGHFSIVT